MGSSQDLEVWPGLRLGQWPCKVRDTHKQAAGNNQCSTLVLASPDWRPARACSTCLAAARHPPVRLLTWNVMSCTFGKAPAEYQLGGMVPAVGSRQSASRQSAVPGQGVAQRYRKAGHCQAPALSLLPAAVCGSIPAALARTAGHRGRLKRAPMGRDHAPPPPRPPHPQPPPPPACPPVKAFCWTSRLIRFGKEPLEPNCSGSGPPSICCCTLSVLKVLRAGREGGAGGAQRTHHAQQQTEGCLPASGQHSQVSPAPQRLWLPRLT